MSIESKPKKYKKDDYKDPQERKTTRKLRLNKRSAKGAKLRKSRQKARFKMLTDRQNGIYLRKGVSDPDLEMI